MNIWLYTHITHLCSSIDKNYLTTLFNAVIVSTSPRNMLVMQVPGSAWSRSTSGRTGQIKRFLSVRPPAYAQENSIFLNSKYQRITMNLIRQWFVFITHVFHSCVKVAYTCRLCVNGCIVLANKIHKPQGMAGVSVCFIKLVSLSPLRSCCGGRGSQVQPGLPTVWAAASTKGAIKEINVMWQPRDTYTYYWTMETYTVSERVAMWLFPGQSFNPSNSIIGYRVFPVVVFFPPLGQNKFIRDRNNLTCSHTGGLQKQE